MKAHGSKSGRPEKNNSHAPMFTEDKLKKAKWVKAVFGGREGMWVKVLEVCEGKVSGTLDNEPVHVDMTLGQRVTIGYYDVVDIMTE